MLFGQKVNVAEQNGVLSRSQSWHLLQNSKKCENATILCFLVVWHFDLTRKLKKNNFQRKTRQIKTVVCSVWLYQTSIGREKFELFSGPTEWREYVSGWGAAVANIFVTFPINKTMFRQMVHGFSTFEALKQLKREGALHLYRGILPPLLQKSSSTAIMFGTYSQYNRLMTNFLGIRNNNQVKKKNTWKRNDSALFSWMPLWIDEKYGK